MNLLKIAALLLVLYSSNLFAQEKIGLRNFTAVVQGQNVKDAKQFISFKQRKVLSLLDASYTPEDIDLAFMYGNNTGLNLLSPTSTAIASFAPKFKINITDGWDIKKEASIIVLRDIVKVQMQFKTIATAAEIANLFTYYELNISALPGYKGRDFGPADGLSRLQVGDIILFKSFTSDGLYAMGNVKSAVKAYTGEMVIDWKIPKKIN